jgi:hypothetical protein
MLGLGRRRLPPCGTMGGSAAPPAQTAFDLTAGLVVAVGLRRWVVDSRYRQPGSKMPLGTLPFRHKALRRTGT